MLNLCIHVYSNLHYIFLCVFEETFCAVKPSKSFELFTLHLLHAISGGEWVNKVYYNHHCFSGPHLSKSRIASLPKCVGPGPIFLVMKEVLSMLINVAYKPCRVLKELQLEGKPNSDMYQQILKAK